MSTSGLPFDDFRDLLANLPGPDEAAVRAVRERDRVLTKPPGALGRLENIAEWLAAWTGRPPAVTRPLVAVSSRRRGHLSTGLINEKAEGSPDLETLQNDHPGGSLHQQAQPPRCRQRIHDDQATSTQKASSRRTSFRVCSAQFARARDDQDFLRLPS